MIQNLGETSPKANFDECYAVYSPSLYVSILLKDLDYRLPFDTMSLLDKHLHETLESDDLKAVFLGSGHGLEPAALKYGCTHGDILRLWLQQNPLEYSFKDDAALPFGVVMVDINAEPLRFARDVGLCDRFCCCDISKDLPEELDCFLRQEADLLVCIGVTSYIGLQGFERLVRLVEASNIKHFCFSLTSFISTSYLEVFERSNLQLQKLGDVRQRSYKNEEEESKILETLIAQGKCTLADKRGLMAAVFMASKQ